MRGKLQLPSLTRTTCKAGVACRYTLQYHRPAMMLLYSTLLYANFFYSMQQIHFSQADSCSSAEESNHSLYKSKVHFRVHNSPPLVSILSQINPVHTPNIPVSLRFVLIRKINRHTTLRYTSIYVSSLIIHYKFRPCFILRTFVYISRR
jgi:hypothetical protein